MDGHLRQRRASLASFLRGPNQLPRENSQGLRDPLDVLQGQISLTALDAADVGAMQTAAFPELLLGQAKGLASVPNDSTHALLQRLTHGEGVVYATRWLRLYSFRD